VLAAPHRREHARVLGVAAVATVVTALVYGIPPVPFGYPLPGAATFAAALTSMGALAICVLFSLRHRRSRGRTDLIIACVFGAVALIESLLPLVAELSPDAADVAFWTRAIARTVVAFVLCAAAWLGDRPLRRRSFARIATASVVSAALIVGATVLWAAQLPHSVDEATDPGNALMPTPGILGARLLGTLLLVLAAIGFVRKAKHAGGPVLEWVACGAVLMGTARLHDFIFPSLHNDWVTTGDVFRLAAQWVILAGLLAEVAELWRRRGHDARERERRVLAAELHDGLAQELAYLTTHSALAARDPANTEHLVRMRHAAERALSETRVRIAEYRQSDHVALDHVIARLGEEAELRYRCRVVLDLSEVHVGARTAHELGRLASEALSNAARHGRPGRIEVSLAASGGSIRLHVADDGEGIIDLTDPTHPTFGLRSMQERAARLGGCCSIVPAPHGGTRVEVEVPQR
jgi:signal transduction histidine kinase